MAVTIQQIAERAGVSRGTVDRALNKRGRVNPEVAEHICALAKEMGYVHKKRVRTPSKEKGPIRIGVVTQLSKSSFMREVMRGIQDAKRDLESRGIEVLLKEGLSVDAKEQLTLIEELEKEGINALAIMPVECEEIRLKLNELIEQKELPVVTFNSDIVGTKRSCFVGMDNRKSGRTAAGLLGMLMRGSGKVLVITGHFASNVDNRRVDGFVEEIKTSFPQIELAGVHSSFDETKEVKKIVSNALINTSGINGILVVSGGQAGVAQAFQDLRLEERPYVIIYDLTPKNQSYLENDVVDFLIDQNGYIQGLQPLRILEKLIVAQEGPEQEYLYTNIDIKTKYNI